MPGPYLADHGIPVEPQGTLHASPAAAKTSALPTLRAALYAWEFSKPADRTQRPNVHVDGPLRPE